MSTDDLVRVRYCRGFTDGLSGASFVDGVSNPIPRLRAARIVAGLGNGARILDPSEEPWPEASPSPVEPPPAPDADLAALPSEPAPDDAPGVSAAHPAPPAPSAIRIPYTHSSIPERPQPVAPRDDRRRGR